MLVLSETLATSIKVVVCQDYAYYVVVVIAHILRKKFSKFDTQSYFKVIGELICTAKSAKIPLCLVIYVFVFNTLIQQIMCDCNALISDLFFVLGTLFSPYIARLKIGLKVLQNKYQRSKKLTFTIMYICSVIQNHPSYVFFIQHYIVFVGYNLRLMFYYVRLYQFLYYK